MYNYYEVFGEDGDHRGTLPRSPDFRILAIREPHSVGRSGPRT